MVFVFCGSISMSVAPLDSATASFRSVQLAPPALDSQSPSREWIGGVTRRAPPRPRKTETKRWLALLGSTINREMATLLKKSPETGAQVGPPSIALRIPLPKELSPERAPSPVPA